MGRESRAEQWTKATKEGTENQNGSLVGKTEGNNQIQWERADQEHGTLTNQMQRVYVQDMHFPQLMLPTTLYQRNQMSQPPMTNQLSQFAASSEHRL